PSPHRLKRLEQVVQDRSAIQTVTIGCRSFMLPRAVRFRLFECFASRLHRLAPTKDRTISRRSLARHAPSVGGQPTLAGEKLASFVRVQARPPSASWLPAWRADITHGDPNALACRQFHKIDFEPDLDLSSGCARAPRDT